MREEAITSLYLRTLPKRLAIADLGCSSGPNTFFVISEVIKLVEKLCREHNHHRSPEYQVFMNDLPGNDFNNIFKSLGSFKENLNKEMGDGNNNIGHVFSLGFLVLSMTGFFQTKVCIFFIPLTAFNGYPRYYYICLLLLLLVLHRILDLDHLHLLNYKNEEDAPNFHHITILNILLEKS